MSSADRPDVLDRVERWARDSLSIASIPHARRVLALVKVARAARETMDKAPALMTDNEFAHALNDLDAALAELEADK